MDEAERCHALAILDRGALVADGTPGDLLENLPAKVVEVESLQIRDVRKRLVALTGVLDAAQIGSRLHVLVSPDIPSPVDYLDKNLDDTAAKLQLIKPNLEDVFVMATQAHAHRQSSA